MRYQNPKNLTKVTEGERVWGHGQTNVGEGTKKVASFSKRMPGGRTF